MLGVAVDVEIMFRSSHPQLEEKAAAISGRIKAAVSRKAGADKAVSTEEPVLRCDINVGGIKRILFMKSKPGLCA